MLIHLRGNTDCKMYYNLTKNIYRFMGSPASLDRASGIVRLTRLHGGDIG